ncbi:MAG: hypothetical protein GTO45_20005 [Candidatus Aminicenantes bacterium]|nr:hypothetical protein [Candidatus Aminicenantes bacterium]NIM81078.1 hypothetical protein [Candidatus Aminicenantes bacterium]NIN20455.1 hypothetical protein [Candidatus Aminicenantes bacterium]NIN44228.1 hypothetical protein [Candidatus Aminicenantes bacterium]NIN87046.1 hypothetical protein [Candidatus Aminicenantes bacterium]
MSKSYWLKDENQTGNFSKQKQDTFDPAKAYTGIRLQKGVPLLDRDWNELEDIRRYAEVMLRKHYIGNGVPDENSFKITAVDPPGNDFRIAGGRCLVDGLEVENGVDFILYSQQEGVEALSVPSSARTDTVYLDVWIEEVTSIQDEALKNANDVRMQTCIRHKLEWRVRVTEGNKSYVQEAFHHYYPVAKIHRNNEKDTIEPADIEDLRITGLALHLLTKKIVADHIVTRSRIVDGAINTVKLADRAVTKAKLNDGSVNENKLSTSVNAKLVTDGDNHTHSANDVGAYPITGGIVSGDIIATGRISSQNARKIASASNEIFISSSRWQDMLNMSFSITTGNSMVIIFFKAGGVVADSPIDSLQYLSASFRILVDDGQVCGSNYRFYYLARELKDVSLHWMGVLSAGNHTVKVQWQTGEGRRISCSSGSTRSLIAIEL